MIVCSVRLICLSSAVICPSVCTSASYHVIHSGSVYHSLRRAVDGLALRWFLVCDFLLWFDDFRFRHSEERLHGPRKVSQSCRAFVARLGLHGLIMTWNCPLWISRGHPINQKKHWIWKATCTNTAVRISIPMKCRKKFARPVVEKIVNLAQGSWQLTRIGRSKIFANHHSLRGACQQCSLELRIIPSLAKLPLVYFMRENGSRRRHHNG